MKPVYQVTGAQRGQNGDCFQACLASLLGRKLDTVPNFMLGTKNGALIPEATLQLMKSWLMGAGCGGYVEFGFQMMMGDLLLQVASQFPDCYYILTGCTQFGRVHSVVCKGNYVAHDPATSPGHTILCMPCADGFFRVGFLLFPTS